MRARAETRLLFASLLLVGCVAEAPPKQVVPVPAPAPPPRDQIIDCANSLDTTSGPVCPAPIDEATQRHRAESDRLFYKAGLVVRVERRKGSGLLNTACPIAELDYDGARHVKTRTCFLSTGRVHDVTKYSDDGKTILNVDDRGRPMFGGYYLCPKSKLEVDANGHDVARRCFDEEGAPREDDQGVHEVRYQRDALGFPTEVSSFDREGRPANTKEGFSRRVTERSPMGDNLSERYFDAQGKPVGLSGTAVTLLRNQLDRWGNRTETRVFGLDEEPTASSRFSNKHRGYDELGNLVFESFFDAKGLPMKVADGAASRKHAYDKHGYLIETALFDERGAEISTAGFRVDEAGRVLERDNKKGTELLSTVSFVYDARDNVVRELHKKPTGELLAFSGSAVGVVSDYDDRDRLTEKTYVNASLSPTASRDGTVTVRYSYDASNVRTEHAFDAQGKALVSFGAKHLIVQYQGAMRADPGVTRTRQEARVRAEEARQKLLKGASFDDVVVVYTDEPGGAARLGDLGHFKRGVMVPSFQEALEATKVGAISEVVETPFGFHVLVRTE